MSDIDILVIKRGGPSLSRITSIKNIDVEIIFLGWADAIAALRYGNFFITRALEKGIYLKDGELKDILFSSVSR